MRSRWLRPRWIVAAAEFVELGDLQGNLGDQNYLVPADVDPLQCASVVIWCERFDSAFGAADLVTS